MKYYKIYKRFYKFDKTHDVVYAYDLDKRKWEQTILNENYLNKVGRQITYNQLVLELI